MQTQLWLIFISLILFGCGGEQAPATTPNTPAIMQDQPAEASAPVKPATTPETNSETGEAIPAPVTTVADKQIPETTDSGILSRNDALKLARKSGCLACHTIEKKLVGPAWQDVAAHYSGKPGSKLQLIEKIKKGGKGNWTEITGGTPMPPYFPRVSENNIKQLVDFILSLNQ